MAPDSKKDAAKTMPVPHGAWHRGIHRDVIGYGLVLVGAFFMACSFLIAYGHVGAPPNISNVSYLVALILIGAIPTVLWHYIAHKKVKVGGGKVFGAAGLLLMVLSYVKAYELMGQYPQWANGFWLAFMVAVGASLVLFGFKAIGGLEAGDRKAWGTAFGGAGFVAIAMSVVSIHRQVTIPSQLENVVVWHVIVASLGGFLVLKGFSLARHLKDKVRMWWEVFLSVAGLATIVSSVIPMQAFENTTIAPMNLWIWIGMLFAIGLFLLLAGVLAAWEGRHPGKITEEIE